MTQVVRIQLFILISYVAVNIALHSWALSFVPAPRVQLSAALHTIFVGYWLWVLRFAPAPKTRWILLDPRSTGAANIPMVATAFLLLPSASNELRLAAGIFTLGATAVLMFGSIRKPPAPGRGALSPIALPAAMAVIFITNPAPYSLGIGLFFAASIIAFMAARGLVQSIFNSAHAANLKAEAALAEARAEREARTRFLESASHDLGQPLQAARLFFDSAMRAPTEAARTTAAGKVEWALDTTQNQLAQMLDHLRLEAGAIAAKPSDVAIGPLLAHLAEVNAPAATAAGIALIAHPSTAHAAADPMLLERALANLIGNAVRHARARTIHLISQRTPGTIKLWVLDDGAGVPLADAARLFDDYFQGSDHGDSIRGGFGLGLASVRRISALLGGRCGHQPRRRGGSAFWLEIPATSPDAGHHAGLPHLR